MLLFTLCMKLLYYFVVGCSGTFPVHRTESGHCLCWDLRKADKLMAMLQVDSEPLFAIDIVSQADKAGEERAASAQGGADASSDDCKAGADSAAAQSRSTCTAPCGGASAQAGGLLTHALASNDAAEADEGPCARDGTQADAGALSVVAAGAASEIFWLDGDAKAGTLRRRRSCKLAEPGIADMSVRSDGRIVAAGAWDGTVRVYHARRCKPLAILKHHTQTVAAVAFRTDTGMLASGGRDGIIALWDVFRDTG
jgi:sugar lactone lactonase YvrE